MMETKNIKTKNVLKNAIMSLEIRQLFFASIHLSELLFDLKKIDEELILNKWRQKIPDLKFVLNDPPLSETEIFAKSLFQTKNFLRCYHFLRNENSAYSIFLRNYARFLHLEQSRNKYFGLNQEINNKNEKNASEEVINLLEDLENHEKKGELDAFSLYLYGITLKLVENEKKAKEVLLRSVNEWPLNWSAWIALSSLLKTKKDIEEISNNCSHWMGLFFFTKIHFPFNGKYDFLIRCIERLDENFPNSRFVKRAKIKVAFDQRFFDFSQEEYEKLKMEDPFYIGGVDDYSNILFVKEAKKDLGILASELKKFHPNRPETALVTANYLSLSGEHKQAVSLFRKAIHLNPSYQDAWILLGHELIETEQYESAIKAYNSALELNERDYRVWYGLGQLHESRKKFSKAFYYYKKAVLYKPDDSRMWTAVGRCHERLDDIEEAIRCFVKSKKTGDEENIADEKLVKLYMKNGDFKNTLKHSLLVAKSALKDFSALPPNSRTVSSALLLAGKNAAKMGEFEEAKECLVKLLDGENFFSEKAKTILDNITEWRKNGRVNFTNGMGPEDEVYKCVIKLNLEV